MTTGPTGGRPGRCSPATSPMSGMGLSMPLDSFDVSLVPDEPAQLIATRPDAEEARRWTMRAFDVAEGYKAAVVIEGSESAIKFWDWPAT